MCRKEAQGPKRAEGAYDRCLLSPSALLRPSGEQPLDTIEHELVVVARSTHRARTDGLLDLRIGSESQLHRITSS
jgi:hypothetical protein